jgi:hypothetical protein
LRFVSFLEICTSFFVYLNRKNPKNHTLRELLMMLITILIRLSSWPKIFLLPFA